MAANLDAQMIGNIVQQAVANALQGVVQIMQQNQQQHQPPPQQTPYAVSPGHLNWDAVINMTIDSEKDIFEKAIRSVYSKKDKKYNMEPEKLQDFLDKVHKRATMYGWWRENDPTNSILFIPSTITVGVQAGPFVDMLRQPKLSSKWYWNGSVWQPKQSPLPKAAQEQGFTPKTNKTKAKTVSKDASTKKKPRVSVYETLDVEDDGEETGDEMEVDGSNG